MYQELIVFIKKNRPTVVSFIGVYISLSIAMNLFSGFIGSETSVFIMAFVSLGLGIMVFLNRMYYFYKIAGSYRPINSKFSVSVLQTVKIYIRYFLKASLLFFVIMIPLTSIILFISPESLLVGNQLQESLTPVFLGFMALYQGIYALLTFGIIFVPLINCTTNSLSPIQSILTSIKIISYEKRNLFRIYLSYQAIMILVATFVSFLASPLLSVIGTMLMLACEILWTIALSWFFIKINLARQTMDEAHAQSLLGSEVELAADSTDAATDDAPSNAESTAPEAGD